MLFVLEKTIANIDPSNSDQVRAFESLLISFQQRNHVLFVEMKTLKTVQEKLTPVLGASNLSTISSLYNSLPEYAILVNLIDYKTYVYIEDEERNGLYKENNCWHVPLTYFSNFSVLNSAVIGENANDSELSLIFANHYMVKKSIRGFFLNARKMCGGGSETPNTLNNYLTAESSPCLCLTDSDKLHPKYQQSPTVRKCEDIERRSNTKIIKHFCFEEREIENIVAHDILKKLNNGKALINDLEAHVIEDSTHWKYIDIKEGIDISWINKKDPVTQKYWKKAKSTFESRKSRCAICKKIGQKENGVCTCGKISGLGDRVLVNVINYLNESDARINLRLLENDLRWEEIAKLTFDFTIAPQKERVRA